MCAVCGQCLLQVVHGGGAKQPAQRDSVLVVAVCQTGDGDYEVCGGLWERRGSLGGGKEEAEEGEEHTGK